MIINIRLQLLRRGPNHCISRLSFEPVNIAKNFEMVTALSGYPAHPEAWRVLGLIGDNGGKSTSEILTGFDQPTAGKIFLRGAIHPRPASQARTMESRPHQRPGARGRATGVPEHHVLGTREPV